MDDKAQKIAACVAGIRLSSGRAFEKAMQDLTVETGDPAIRIGTLLEFCPDRWAIEQLRDLTVVNRWREASSIDAKLVDAFADAAPASFFSHAAEGLLALIKNRPELIEMNGDKVVRALTETAKAHLAEKHYPGIQAVMKFALLNHEPDWNNHAGENFVTSVRALDAMTRNPALNRFITDEAREMMESWDPVPVKTPLRPKDPARDSVTAPGVK